MLKENEHFIFKKIPKGQLFIPDKNTFDYFDLTQEFSSIDEYWETIKNDIYCNQYIFFFKYLRNALGFCHNSSKRNYILVADIDKKILKNFIGCGRYTDNRVEFRVPRSFVTVDTIKDFLFYEPFDDDQTKELMAKYPNNFYSKDENDEANQIMKQKKLEFNEYKQFPKFN